MTINVHMPKIGLTLFGRFTLSMRGQEVPLPSRKLAGLLAYLACMAPQPQPREKLANLLWGSHFEVQARQNLRQALFRLKKLLGEDALVANDTEVWLTPDTVDCDVARFKTRIYEGSPASLVAAADLYRYPLLADLNIAEETWSDWRDAERERMEGMALNAMVRNGQQALQSGEIDLALQAAGRAISINSLREDAHRLTVQALVAAGRKAEALKHYHDLVARLERELGVEPDALTQALAAELRGAGEPALLRAATEHPSNLPVTSRGRINAFDRPGSPASHPLFERRQLTIMSCRLDMGDLTGIDSEDVYDLTAAFHVLLADIVGRLGGFIAQYQDRGALVYFGYPRAHEQDAERAVRTGLEILKATKSIDAPAGIAVSARVGIASGAAVVGEMPQSGNGRQHVAMGDIPHLATQLQAAAAPDTISISAGSRRLVERVFVCREQRTLVTNGSPGPIEVWQVIGEAVDPSLFDARRMAPPRRLFGRQEESDLLLRRWSQAKAGEGRVVLVSGEPGIGKSSIAGGLLTDVGGEAHTQFHLFCSPYHAHSPLYPFLAQLERSVQFEPGSSTLARLDKLEDLLKPTAADMARDVTLIGQLLSVPTDDRYPSLSIGAEQKRELLLSALSRHFEGPATHRPALIVVEDVHWMDPTSLELLDRLIMRSAGLPLLMVVTFRPEFQPNWIGHPHVTMLSLGRLSPGDSAGVVRDIARNTPLPTALVEQILARTDGVPLFIEELTNTLLDSGLETSRPAQTIPMTLQASLTARLDLLGSAKDVATTGAAIGREFSFDLVSAVSGLAPADLDAALDRLTGSGLVTRRGIAPNATYSFKHALVQEAAYAGMLRSRRRQLHADIAKTLVENFPALVESRPEIVARHFEEADLIEAAVDHWRKAGRLAWSSWANLEALSYFEQALRLLETLPETRENLERTIDLRFDLTISLTPLGEFDRILTCLRGVDSLAKKLDDKRRLCQFFAHMCQTLNLGGFPKDAIAIGLEAKALAAALGDISLQVALTLFLGTACNWTHDYRVAEQHFLDVLRILDAELDSDLGLEQFSLVGHPVVLARSFLTRLYTLHGHFAQGIVHGEEAIRLAERVDHPYSLAMACWCLADLFAGKGEFDRSALLAERGVALAREWNLPSLVAGNLGSLGYARALLGHATEGLELLRESLDAFEAMGHRFAQSLFLIPLAEAHRAVGRQTDARRFAEQALAMARETGQRSGEANALYLLGEVPADDDTPEVIAGYYRNALSLAVELEMRPLTARCHYGLAMLYLRDDQLHLAGDELTTATMMCQELGMRIWWDEAGHRARCLVDGEVGGESLSPP